MAAAAGVDDVHLIAALALHRRMTEDELRHAVGDRVYDAFAPAGSPLQPRRRGPRQPGLPGHHQPRRGGRDQQAGGRVATCSSTSTSTSSRWTAATRAPPPAWPATARISTTTTCTPWSTPRSSWTATTPSCTTATGAWARSSPTPACKVFQIETTINNDTFGDDRPDVGAAEARVGVDHQGPGHLHGHAGRASTACRSSARRKIFQSHGRPTASPRCTAGAIEPVHETHPGALLRPAPRAGRGPDRHPHHGAALHLPLQRELDHEPDPGHVPGARVLLQHVPGASRWCGRAAC